MKKDSHALTVLLIEDNATDAQHILSILHKQDGYRCLHRERLAAGLQTAVEHKVDVVLLDLNLPDSEGIDTLHRWLASARIIPVVILTASDDDALATRALHEGAQDYMIKGYLQVYPQLLDRAIRYAIERHKNHAQLQLAREQLIQHSRYEALRRLAGGLAHEVKNPLQVILMGIDYLAHRQDPRDDVTSSVLHDIHEAVRRADWVLTELQSFGSRVALKRRALKVADIFSQALDQVLGKLKAAGIGVYLNHSETPEILVDPTSFKIAFIDLLMHAFHALPQGGTLRVESYRLRMTQVGPSVGNRTTDRFRLGDEAVVVDVVYEGSQITEAQLSEVFDPFSEYSTGDNKDPASVLGLASAQKTVEAHQGVITARCTHEGAFAIRLMLKAAPTVTQ
jgi:signal transduction histidine kinase